jgi:hypothetical protein
MVTGLKSLHVHQVMMKCLSCRRVRFVAFIIIILLFIYNLQASKTEHADMILWETKNWSQVQTLRAHQLTG